MSIGIDDIALSNNSYVKEGTYISKPYILDFVPYSFALKVKEVIPDYGSNINPYDIIKYYVEFNSNDWIRISPITRSDEFENNKIVPKLILFDFSESEEPHILYTKFDSNVKVFRVKIVFDTSIVNSSNFTPPEVHDYKSVIFYKHQLLDI